MRTEVADALYGTAVVTIEHQRLVEYRHPKWFGPLHDVLIETHGIPAMEDRTTYKYGCTVRGVVSAEGISFRYLCFLYKWLCVFEKCLGCKKEKCAPILVN